MREFDTDFIGDNWIESSQLEELKGELIEEKGSLILAVDKATTTDEFIRAFDELQDFRRDYAPLIDDIETAEHMIYPLWENATLINADFFTEYAQEKMVDAGFISFEFPGWNLIDWDRLADDMLMDYQHVKIGGHEYYSRK